MLETISEPLISCTLQFPGEEEPVSSPADYRALLDHSVDIVIAGGPCGTVPTTVLDLRGYGVQIVREGKGDTALLLSQSGWGSLGARREGQEGVSLCTYCWSPYN